MANLTWKFGDSSKVPDDVKYAIGVTLGAAVWHPSVESLLLSVGRDIRRRRRNERERARRRAVGDSTINKSSAEAIATPRSHTATGVEPLPAVENRDSAADASYVATPLTDQGERE